MQSYLVFLSELCRALDTLTGLEQRKITAVRAGDLEELDRCMKQEQAAALDLRLTAEELGILDKAFPAPDHPTPLDVV